MLPQFAQETCIRCFQCGSACPMGVIGPGEDGFPTALPRRRCIACMHCAAICPRQAVRFEGLSREELYPEPPTDPVEALICSRRSVRSFRETLPERQVIEWALDRAEYAPSGKNIHATRWTVLWGLEATEKVTQRVIQLCNSSGEAPELPKLLARGTNLITCGAPCVILGWSPDDCLNPVVDTAVATATLELLLQSKGLATCWGGYLNQMANHHPELRAALGIPEGSGLRCALMVGYPKGESYRSVPYRPKAEVQWLSTNAIE